MKSEAWVGDWLQKSENIVREEHMSEFTIASRCVESLNYFFIININLD